MVHLQPKIGPGKNEERNGAEDLHKIYEDYERVNRSML